MKIIIKSILLKLFQVLLFAISIYIYIELVNTTTTTTTTTTTITTTSSSIYQFINNNSNNLIKLEKNEFQLYSWIIGIILFSIAWSIGTFKLLSRFFLTFFIIKSIQQLIQHLPIIQYNQLKELIINFTLNRNNSNISNELILKLWSQFIPNTYSFNSDIIGIQCLLIIFFSTLGFNIYLADKFWLIKTIIVDWIVSAILLIVSAISDLLKKQNNLFLVISYIFGSNVLGFGTIKLQEYFWNLSSKIDDKFNNTTTSTTTTTTTSTQPIQAESSTSNMDDSIIYDTDSNFGENNNTTTTSNYVSEKVMIEENGEIKEQELQVDNLDYNKLSEDQLNEILSEPILESQVSTRNVSYHKSTRFINNLIAPENINSRISAKEFVGVIILWVYTISNIIIENYQSYTTSNILVVIGFSGTILTYLSTISAKRLTNKNPSKREC